MNYIILGFCFTLMANCAAGAQPAQPLGVTVYVSPLGDDAHAGTPEQPLQTFTRARDLLRKASDAAPKKMIVRGGEYYDVSLELGPEDSGLVIQAAQGETPVLYGGRLVTGWQQEGEHPGENPGENLYAAQLPEVQEGAWDFRMLQVNGRFCPRARLPMGGHFRHLSRFDVPWLSTSQGGWNRKPTEEEFTTLAYKPSDLGPWLNLRNAEITIYHSWDESVVGIKSLDPANNTITFNTPSGHPAGAFGNHDYVVWNVREGLTTPGQWYLDRDAGKVVYWPLSGEDMLDAKVIAPTQERVISITGAQGKPARNITLEGLTVSVTTTPLVAAGFAAGRYDGAISLDGTKNCTLTGLTVRNVNGQGIKAVRSDGLRIDSCEVAYTGAAGIVARGENVIIEHNRIHHCGFTYPSGPGISSGAAHIAHNEIYNIAYSAIIGQGLIESNLIYDFMKVMEDGGAIYVTFCKNALVRGNAIFGNGKRWSVHALYIDEQGANCLLEGNLAVNTGCPSHNHMARDNTIRNNIFMDEGTSLVAFPKSSGFTFERNIVVGQQGIVFLMPGDAIAAMPNNIFYSSDGELQVELISDNYAGPIALEPRDGSLIADPLLTRGPSGDYNPRLGSPAEKLGILPLDLQSVGRTGIATPKSFVNLQIEMLEHPRQLMDGTLNTGQARLLVENLGDVTAEGTIDIWALPSQAVSLSGVERSLTFSLEAGQRLEQRFNVSAASQDELQLGAQIRNDPNTGTMTQFFVPRDVKIPRLAAATLEEIPALLANQSPARWQYLGNTVCELRMGVAGDQLAVSAEIYNNAITPELAVWEQTNMDIYCSQPGSSTVRQVVIMPKSPQGDGQVLLFENGDEQARPEVQWQAKPLANSGYQLTALIPLSVLRVDAERPFLFESAVVVPPDRDAAPVFVTLCGSTNAFMNNAKYHTIYVEPEHGESTKQ